jgi:hypothetical protein
VAGFELTIGGRFWVITEDQFRIEERPYVVASSPAFFNGTLAANQKFFVNVTYGNIGKTPALRLFIAHKVVRYDVAPSASGMETGLRKLTTFLDSTFKALGHDTDAEETKAARFGAEQDLAPGDTYFYSDPPDFVIPSKDFGRLANGTTAIFAVGVISYSNAFGSRYRTDFCWLYFGDEPAVWHRCDSHNTIQ